MALFPLFVSLKGKPILVVGAGRVAARKVANLLPFEPKITVVAPQADPFIKELADKGLVKLQLRSFERSDLDGAFLVIGAVDNVELQKSIFEECRKRNIPVNCVDKPEFCTFIFPSLVVRGDLVVGISTSGRAPSVSKRVRQIIERCLPEDIDSVIDEIARLRSSGSKNRQQRVVEATERMLPIEGEQ